LLTPIVDAVPPAHLSIYGASRGAQSAWVKAIGLELAPFNINVNAIAQENVDNNLMRSGAGEPTNTGTNSSAGCRARKWSRPKSPRASDCIYVPTSRTRSTAR